MAVEEKVSQVPSLFIDTGSAMTTHGFTYSPLLFLRVMLAVAWSAFAHPFSSTVIDLGTGRICPEDREEGE